MQIHARFHFHKHEQNHFAEPLAFVRARTDVVIDFELVITAFHLLVQPRQFLQQVVLKEVLVGILDMHVHR